MWHARWPLVLALVIPSACGRLRFEVQADDGDGGLPDSQALEGCATSPGLALYWPLDENGGPVATDVSPNHQFGDLSGAVTWVPGHLGTALQFDVDGTVAFRTTTGLSFGGGTGSFTFSYWVAPTDLTSRPDIRPFELAFCTGSSYILAFVGGSGTAGFSGYDASGHYATSRSAAGVLQLGRWTHVVHVLDRSTQLGQTYIDGVASGMPADLSPWTDTIDCSTTPGTAANLGGWGSFDYVGAIDDVRIYDRALAPAEITDLYQLTASGCP